MCLNIKHHLASKIYHGPTSVLFNEINLTISANVNNCKLKNIKIENWGKKCFTIFFEMQVIRTQNDWDVCPLMQISNQFIKDQFLLKSRTQNLGL